MECREPIAEARKSSATHVDCSPVGIDAEKEPTGARCLKDCLCVPATTEVGVDVGAVWSNHQCVEQFSQQDGAMEGRTRRH